MFKYTLIFAFFLFSSLGLARDLYEIEQDTIELSQIKKKNFSKVNALWREVAYSKIEEKDAKMRKELILLRSNLLITISKMRSELIADPDTHYPLEEVVQDSWTEIKLIPDRWTSIYRIKLSTIEEKKEEGILKNFTFFAQEILVLVLIFSIPFFISKFSTFSLNRTERFRQERIRYSYNKKIGYTLFLQRVSPYIPWFLLLVFLAIFKTVLSKSFFSELTLLIPYLEYYLWYRILRQLIGTILYILSEKAMLGHSGQTKERVNKTALFYGRFIFFYFILLHSISSVVSEGLVYSEVKVVALVCAVFFLYRTLYRWQDEVHKVLQDYMGPKVYAFLSRFRRKTFFVFSAPIFFLLAIYLPFQDWLLSLVGEFELTKKLTTTLFKRKLESNESLETKEDLELPQDYLDYFNFNEAEIDEEILPTHDPLDLICREINEWRNGESDEHSLAIYGAKGAGKSTTLSRLERKYHDLSIIRTDVPSKLLSRKDVFSFLGNLLFQKSIEEITEFIELSAELPETLVLLDEVQNFFLAKLGGFEGMRAFFDVLNLPTQNIFWVASCNEFSWNYIDQVFGRSRYFRTSIALKGFLEEDLKKLIMTRHEKTSYKLSYSEIIKAMRSADERDGFTYIENQFFRFLWEESKGNPRSALHLWLSSLTPKRKGIFRVGLPSYPKISVLSQLSSESHFVYASILRHENITTEQLIDATAISEGTIRHSLKIGLENSFIERDQQGRYRATPKTQGTLISFLRSRNIIYG